MVTAASFVTACSLFGLSFAAPIRRSAAPRGVVVRNAYVMFGGDGTLAAGWPSRESWMSFDKAWVANLDIIQSSCQNGGWGDNNSDAETQAIKDSIATESQMSGIPKELILAIVMQESKGCVRAPTTRWSHDNPGLMQSDQGKGTCNPDGNPINPCPISSIRQMIHDGTNGDGLHTTLRTCLANTGATNDSKWYKAARLYNAGRITNNNLGIGPTPCYASDIANRLTNPFDASVCNSAVIGSLSSAQGAVAGVNSTPDGSTSASTKPQSAPTASPAEPASVPAATLPPATGVFAETPKTGSAKPDLVIDGAAKGCVRYFTPKSGDTCASAPVDFATLRQLNAPLNSGCTNLWAGYAYCIAI